MIRSSRASAAAAAKFSAAWRSRSRNEPWPPRPSSGRDSRPCRSPRAPRPSESRSRASPATTSTRVSPVAPPEPVRVAGQAADAIALWPAVAARAGRRCSRWRRSRGSAWRPSPSPTSSRSRDPRVTDAVPAGGARPTSVARIAPIPIPGGGRRARKPAIPAGLRPRAGRRCRRCTRTWTRSPVRARVDWSDRTHARRPPRRKPLAQAERRPEVREDDLDHPCLGTRREAGRRPRGSRAGRRSRRRQPAFQVVAIIARTDLDDAVHPPPGMRRIGRCAARDQEFEVLEFVDDLGTAAREAVVEADRKVGPGLRVVERRFGRHGIQPWGSRGGDTRCHRELPHGADGLSLFAREGARDVCRSPSKTCRASRRRVRSRVHNDPQARKGSPGRRPWEAQGRPSRIAAGPDAHPTSGLPSRRSIAVEPQVLGRDGAEYFLGVGLAAGDLEQGGAAEVEQPGPRRPRRGARPSADCRRSARGARG